MGKAGNLSAWGSRHLEDSRNGSWGTRADLSVANLQCANLSHVPLECENPIGADLTGANLTGADLSGADLTGANLMGANLMGANLQDANIMCADLAGANLTGANLQDADLKGAKGVNLEGAIY